MSIASIWSLVKTYYLHYGGFVISDGQEEDFVPVAPVLSTRGLKPTRKTIVDHCSVGGNGIPKTCLIADEESAYRAEP